MVSREWGNSGTMVDPVRELWVSRITDEPWVSRIADEPWVGVPDRRRAVGVPDCRRTVGVPDCRRALGVPDCRRSSKKTSTTPSVHRRISKGGYPSSTGRFWFAALKSA